MSPTKRAYTLNPRTVNMWHDKKESAEFKTGRLSWISLLDPGQSQGSLKKEKESRKRLLSKQEGLNQSLLALKVEKEGREQRTVCPIEAGKIKKTDSIQSVQKEISSANALILAQWEPPQTCDLHNCETTNVCCLSHYTHSTSTDRKLLQSTVSARVLVSNSIH